MTPQRLAPVSHSTNTGKASLAPSNVLDKPFMQKELSATTETLTFSHRFRRAFNFCSPIIL